MAVSIVAVVIITVISTVTTVGEAAPLSFNFTSFEPCSDAAVKLYGDAYCADSGVRVTGFDYYVSGQARYPKPMRLWDRSTGQLANFTTAFTFAIDNDGGSWTCDGVAFFLASADYVTPTDASEGRLGLVDRNHTFNATAADNPFVAVEFDTYDNAWDTWRNESHVGIDVSSMRSVVSKRWKSYVDGTLMWARVSYDGGKLCALFTGVTVNLTDVPMDSVCYEVDLRNYLTEWAVFGFSASTAWRYQSHTVYSWSFSSDLDS
ncbi:unnamed protein product [Linum tenue]|uniref:Legume lectin domain-containing protein n=2 Tax=Linum tenue TaxID=586396 RepID=A0AAV0N7Y5_9ROSI|nr:unnamed protein product [Linum tenue]